MRTITIRALANPNNLFHCTVFKPFEQLSGATYERTTLNDGEEFVLETVDFPNGQLREIRLHTGDWYRCDAPGGHWTCIGGSNFGKKFDYIEYWPEYGDDDTEWAGCLFINVIAHKVVYHTMTE